MVTDSVAKLPVEEKKQQQQQQQGDKPLILPLPPKPALVPKPSTGQLRWPGSFYFIYFFIPAVFLLNS